MQIDHRTRISPVQDLAHTLHRHPVECQIINIQTIDADILNQPVQAFHIIIMPTRNTRIHNCRIFYRISKPGSNIILIIMFLKP